MNHASLRHLPSIDVMLRRAKLQSIIFTAGREVVRDQLRKVLAEMRRELSRTTVPDFTPEALVTEIESRLEQRFTRRAHMMTQRVINATGVVLHTNLGRAALSHRALEAINEIAQGYCNLEFNLATGRRGQRGAGLEVMLRGMFGCEAAAVVNNCAAAVLIMLNTLAEGGEVIISRGELIEIGGSFRIPDVIAKAGALIREVGSTNRTRLSDYEAAINEQTRAILRVHPSNYRIVGFTERPDLTELVNLARAHDLPLLEDLGSGCILDFQDEPVVGQALKSGAAIVTFSGDKLLGGPQAGIILGRERLVSEIKCNPLMRALRVDKLTYAALEATFLAYSSGNAVQEIPVQAALRATKEEISRRARNFVRRVERLGNNWRLKLIDGASIVGGGSAPGTELPTKLISLSHNELSLGQLEERLRAGTPPVIARIAEDQLTLDLRTVLPTDESALLNVFQSIQAEC